VKNGMSENPPPPSRSPNILGKEILISAWNARSSATPFWLGKISSHPSRNTQVTALFIPSYELFQICGQLGTMSARQILKQ
jgi:hypothetical protein